jgi:hypothetical protein
VGGIVVWMWVLLLKGNHLEVAATVFGKHGTTSVIGGCFFFSFFFFISVRRNR